MDWFDRQIVQYMRMWVPFGGPPEEEILPRFGLTVSQFNARFNDILSSLQTRTAALSHEERELLTTLESMAPDRPTAVDTLASRT